MQDLKKLKAAYQNAYKGYEKALQSAAAATDSEGRTFYAAQAGVLWGLYVKAREAYTAATWANAEAEAVADIEAIYNNIREKLELLKENEGARL